MATEWGDTPYPSGLANGSTWTRRYADALGRPMGGKVVLTADAWIEVGEDVIPPSSVPVELDSAGFARADLPPGSYNVREQLMSPDGQSVGREWKLTLL